MEGKRSIWISVGLLILANVLIVLAFMLSGCTGAAAIQSRETLCRAHASDSADLQSACLREPTDWIDLCQSAATVTTERELIPHLQAVCDHAANESAQ
jgi:hypothetical protein